MKEIKLTRGQVALVDDECYDLINQYKWFAHWRPKAKTFYAARNSKDQNGRRHTGV